MTLKTDAKFEEKLFCCLFKNDKKMVKCDLSTQKCALSLVPIVKVFNV